ncbi:MAG TPA: metalloregulator ArsR/SmtB family transcription factor [Polyangiaceae bacterium]
MNIEGAVSMLQTFADATRVRLLGLLADGELTVAELTAITELSQSRVSTHLGRLKESGLLRDRRVGTSTYYALREDTMPGEARSLWQLLHGVVGDSVIEGDRKRKKALLRARSGSWPDAVAGEMERHYSPGRTWDATARGLLGIARFGDVLDVGGGDGAVAELYLSRSKSVTLLDRSERMLEAARDRLSGRINVRFSLGDMHALPFSDGAFDEVLMLNVLSYSEEPARAVAEAARVLRPGGRLAVVTLAEHEHEDVTATYGHLGRGFAARAVRALLVKSGLEVDLCEITSRERRRPYFEVLSAFARRPATESATSSHREEAS